MTERLLKLGPAALEGLLARARGGSAPALRLALELAGQLRAAGRTSEHISALEAITAAFPKEAEASCDLVRALLRQGRHEQAQAALRRSPLPAGDPRRLFLAGCLADKDGRLEEAARLFERSAKGQARLETYFHLAQCLLRLGRVDRMLAALRRAEGVEPEAHLDEVRRLLDRFRLAVCSCDYPRAAALAEQVLGRTRRLEHLEVLRWPTFIDEFDFTYGNAEYFRAALASLEALIAADPKLPWGYYYRAVLADSDAFKACKPGPAPDPQEDLARVDALAADRHAWMRLELAKARLYREDLPAALEHFRRAAAASEPPNWNARCQAAEILLCLGKPAQAEAAFDEALRETSGTDRGCVLAWKGEFYLWSGKYERARECLDEALKTSAQYAHAWKGGALVMLGRPGEALPFLERAISVSPWDVEARVWLAEAQLRLGRPGEGAETIDAALKAGGAPNFYCHVLRGLCRQALGDRKGAREDAEALPGDVREHGSLEKILRDSKGVRRGGYAKRAWLKPKPRVRSR